QVQPRRAPYPSRGNRQIPIPGTAERLRYRSGRRWQGISEILQVPQVVCQWRGLRQGLGPAKTLDRCGQLAREQCQRQGTSSATRCRPGRPIPKGRCRGRHWQDVGRSRPGGGHRVVAWWVPGSPCDRQLQVHEMFLEKETLGLYHASDSFMWSEGAWVPVTVSSR